MSTAPECLTNVIGLSRTTCECFAEGPLGYDESLSGLYLDELIEVGIIKDLENCANGGEFWELMARARAQAIQQLRADTLAGILQYNNLARPVFAGVIGNLKFTKDIISTTAYRGLRIRCADVVGGEMTIGALGAAFNFTGTVDVYVYDNTGELVAGPYTIDTLADTNRKTLITPLTLPLHVDGVDNVEYYFLYANPGVGLNAKNVSVQCNCNNWRATFNCDAPYWGTQSPKGYGWSRWCMVGGYTTPDLNYDTMLEMAGTVAGNETYGITLHDVKIICQVGEVVCYDEIDFASDPLAASIAFALRLKAGEYLIGSLLRSPNIIRNVLINHEQLAKDAAEWAAKYGEYVSYIVRSVDIKKNDCFVCKELLNIRTQTIFS